MYGYFKQFIKTRSPIDITSPWISTELSLMHPDNNSLSIVVTFGGTVIFGKLIHIYSTLKGIVIDGKLKHLLKANDQNDVTSPKNSTDSTIHNN
ncbi:hypothetical protein M9Y10_010883 [Tritrichomonas musculus]|uniref:Uncharacterized protein n=1 Tax=Tritrichomonas musculus TaxID=1915356 RepID=A0ABR2ILZ2_9EUKA